MSHPCFGRSHDRDLTHFSDFLFFLSFCSSCEFLSFLDTLFPSFVLSCSPITWVDRASQSKREREREMGWRSSSFDFCTTLVIMLVFSTCQSCYFFLFASCSSFLMFLFSSSSPSNLSLCNFFPLPITHQPPSLPSLSLSFSPPLIFPSLSIWIVSVSYQLLFPSFLPINIFQWMREHTQWYNFLNELSFLSHPLILFLSFPFTNSFLSLGTNSSIIRHWWMFGQWSNLWLISCLYKHTWILWMHLSKELPWRSLFWLWTRRSVELIVIHSSFSSFWQSTFSLWRSSPFLPFFYPSSVCLIRSVIHILFNSLKWKKIILTTWISFHFLEPIHYMKREGKEPTQINT